MALFVKQDEQRSQLQERVAAELQERAKKRAELADRPDGVSDSQYMKGTKKTTSLAWVWIVLTIAVIVLVVWLIANPTK